MNCADVIMKMSKKTEPLLIVGRSLALGCALTIPVACAAQSGVPDGGAPVFVQSLSVPPGAHRMSPNLAIAYAGGAVNGAIGYGWS